MMDYTSIGITVSLVSLSFAVVKAGFKTTNNKYVSQKDCHTAQDAVRREIDNLRSHIDTRIEDLKDFIKSRDGK